MGVMAELAARWRTGVRLNLPELDALLAAAGQQDLAQPAGAAAAWRRLNTRSTVSDLVALTAAGQFRGSRDLDSAVRRIGQARDRRRRAVNRAAGA